MSYRIKVMPRATGDLQTIFDWIAERAPDGAERWYESFCKGADRIIANPNGLSLAREDAFVPGHDLRQFLFKTRKGRTYRAVYVVVENEVRILRVRGPGESDLTADELEDV